MPIMKGFWKWVARAAINRFMKAHATAQGGPLNSSWEAVVGNIPTTASEGLFGDTSDKKQLDAYGTHALTYSCVRRISTAFCEATPTVGSENEDNQFEALAEHSVLDLIEHPNKTMSSSEFNERRVMNLLLTGKSFTWKWRDVRGNIAELWPMPSSFVTVIAAGKTEMLNGGNFISHYEIKLPGSHSSFKVLLQDMIYSRFPDPLNFLEGIGPLEAAFRDLTFDRERESYLIEMLANMATPGLVFTREMDFDPTDKKELRELLGESIGRGLRGSPLFIGGNASVEMIAPLKDLDWPGLSAMVESHICGAFGVPPLLVGARVAQENTALSSPNLQAAESVFYRGTMTALWIHEANSLTHGLLMAEGDNILEVRYDLTRIRALQEDQERLSAQVESGIRSGVMQVNEGREILGLAPDPTQDGIYLRSAAVIEVSGNTLSDDDFESTDEPEGMVEEDTNTDHLQEDEDDDDSDTEAA